MAQGPDADFIALQTALAGEYSLDREIGRGGMAIIYLAREVSLERAVAIKVLLPGLAAQPALREAFLAEARIGAQLNHPNIIPIYAAGVRDHVAFIAMSYVDGQTLGERIRARGALSSGQTAQVLREVCWALAYAHSSGIVHRDISAENILLERGTSRAIVMDFGIASAMQTAAVAADGHVIGNANYVSPEQAAGEPLDARSDIYSLGVCAFYALTGRLPFKGRSPADVVQMHLALAPPAVNSFAESVPSRLAQAVDRALAKDPARRHQSAEKFAESVDLATEQTRVIPAPLRTWINLGEREGSTRVALFALGALAGSTVVTLTGNPVFFLWPFPLITIGSFLPSLLRLRRAIGEGYGADDIYSALREHAAAREEEIAFERNRAARRVRRLLWLLLGGSVAASLYLAQRVAGFAGENPALARAYLGGATQTLFLMGVSSVLLIGDYSRMHLGGRLNQLKLSFWKSRIGSRFARLLGLGLNASSRPADSLSLTTELALGRATDHLFQALPKVARKELAALPELVRTLECTASALRSRISEIDTQLALFDRTAKHSPDGTVLEADMREVRAESAARLGATVGALENIRLGLLRLQMDVTDVVSVTAALEKARALGEELALAANARREVELLLQSPVNAQSASAPPDDDDADTPVSGVPATHR